MEDTTSALVRVVVDVKSPTIPATRRHTFCAMVVDMCVGMCVGRYLYAD